jgi:hypothetical protein
MSNYWPSGLELSDTQSPREILKVAQEEWYTSSEGVMELVLQDAESESGNSMIIVHAKHVPSNRTSTLLSVVHRPDNPYPVTIQLEDEDLPNFLKKSYYLPDPMSSARATAKRLDMSGQTIENRWVSDTPAEFRKKLAEAFNLGAVKSRILNLALDASDASDDTNEESQEDSAEN